MSYAGQIFGQWAISKDLGTFPVGRYRTKSGSYLPLMARFVIAKCKCGKVKTLRFSNLSNGKTTQCKSCAISKRNTVHNLSKHPLYRTWVDIKKRCYNPKSISYQWYGAKGVKVCKRWLNSFPNFLKDMGEKPSPEYSIDRINPYKNYSKSNCRWATIKMQNKNKRKREK